MGLTFFSRPRARSPRYICRWEPRPLLAAFYTKPLLANVAKFYRTKALRNNAWTGSVFPWDDHGVSLCQWYGTSRTVAPYRKSDCCSENGHQRRIPKRSRKSVRGWPKLYSLVG